jgi:lipase (class 3)
VPANPLHVLGCNVIDRVHTVTEGAIDFSDLGCQLVDEVIATDLDGVVTRYGVLLVSTDTPNRLLVFIRGTKSAIEWVSDGVAVLEACRFAPGCKTEKGFTDIYETFRLKSGRTIISVISGFARAVVFGHSLGGPLATYLAAQMQVAELVCYASPKPGDAAFARFVRANVPTITLYDDVPDVVPKLPFTLDDPLDEFDFVHVLPVLTAMDPKRFTPPVSIPPGIAGAHAITTYKALLLAA